MRPLHGKEIDLAAQHASETTRLSGVQEQARRELENKHAEETKALHTELGIPEEPEIDFADGVSLAKLIPMFLSMLGKQSIESTNFDGPVSPPVDSPPGIPVIIPPPAVHTSRVELPLSGGIIPPIVATTPTRPAPMPGTGTHPGCSVQSPCAKHGGEAMANPDAPPLVVAAEPTHYDGRQLSDKTVVCTMFKPCAECVNRSRRPFGTPDPRKTGEV